MKIHLHRGKDIKDGSWVLGGAFHDVREEKSYIITEYQGKTMSFHFPEEIDSFKGVEVDTKTVGQYVVTGYMGEYDTRHSNHVPLYQGDIVEAWSQGYKGTFIIAYRRSGAPIFMLYPAWFAGTPHGADWHISAGRNGNLDDYDDLRLIGNIWDNPGLMKPEDIEGYYKL